MKLKIAIKREGVMSNAATSVELKRTTEYVCTGNSEAFDENAKPVEKTKIEERSENERTVSTYPYCEIYPFCLLKPTPRL